MIRPARTQTVGLGPGSTARVNRVAQPYLLCTGQTAAEPRRPNHGVIYTGSQGRRNSQSIGRTPIKG
jgi:hypothetical protein